MSDQARLGTKVRALRRREGITQAQMAQRLGISPSYLNLIENDKRPLTAQLLISLAREFEVDVATFAADEEAELTADLMEAFSDRLFAEEPLTNQDVRELVTASPAAARAVRRMYQALSSARERAHGLAEQLTGGFVSTDDDDTPALVPSEDVSDFLQHAGNHFPDLEAAAERLWTDAKLDDDDLVSGLIRWLGDQHKIRVEIVPAGAGARRRYDPAKRTIWISELLPPRSRTFQLAHQLALIEQRERLDELTAEKFHDDETSRLARVALANYFAGAVLMPYAAIHAAAEEVRYDVELLGHRFRTSYEQVCHRLTTLNRPGQEGVPFHFTRVDVAGNISKRYSGSGIRFARFSGACPRWNVFSAFLTPGMIRVQCGKMLDGDAYFCFARTVRGHGAGYHDPQATYAIGMGCRLEHAERLVYSDGVDLKKAFDSAVPIGVTCRLCERMDCPQRAFPPITAPLEVDENVRGPSFYAHIKGGSF